LIFSLKKSPDLQNAEPASSLLRVVQQLLEGFALHCVEFDSEEQTAFRTSIREIADRFDQVSDHKDLLILAGEANKTIQNYNQLVEKFVRELSTEKQLAVELLAQALLRVCRSSDQAAQNLRQIEKDLAKASQLQDMRELRSKLAQCVGTLCMEAEVQEAQFRELSERIAESSSLLEPRDQITGLSTLKGAEARIKAVSATGNGYVIVYFLKNVDVVNRRFGFSAGDDVLRRFAGYLAQSLQAKDQLFRWRGPCFVVVADRFAPLDTIRSEAYKIGVRGPEVEVESEGKSMLIRLTAATTAFPISRSQGRSVSEISAKIDQFAAEQFKILPATR
jgi:GGDEF domain-containing protein